MSKLLINYDILENQDVASSLFFATHFFNVYRVTTHYTKTWLIHCRVHRVNVNNSSKYWQSIQY